MEAGQPAAVLRQETRPQLRKEESIYLLLISVFLSFTPTQIKYEVKFKQCIFGFTVSFRKVNNKVIDLESTGYSY